MGKVIPQPVRNARRVISKLEKDGTDPDHIELVRKKLPSLSLAFAKAGAPHDYKSLLELAMKPVDEFNAIAAANKNPAYTEKPSYGEVVRDLSCKSGNSWVHVFTTGDIKKAKKLIKSQVQILTETGAQSESNLEYMLGLSILAEQADFLTFLYDSGLLQSKRAPMSNFENMPVTPLFVGMTNDNLWKQVIAKNDVELFEPVYKAFTRDNHHYFDGDLSRLLRFCEELHSPAVAEYLASAIDKFDNEKLQTMRGPQTGRSAGADDFQTACIAGLSKSVVHLYKELDLGERVIREGIGRAVNHNQAHVLKDLMDEGVPLAWCVDEVLRYNGIGVEKIYRFVINECEKQGCLREKFVNEAVFDRALERGNFELAAIILEYDEALIDLQYLGDLSRARNLDNRHVRKMIDAYKAKAFQIYDYYFDQLERQIRAGNLTVIQQLCTSFFGRQNMSDASSGVYKDFYGVTWERMIGVSPRREGYGALGWLSAISNWALKQGDIDRTDYFLDLAACVDERLVVLEQLCAETGNERIKGYVDHIINTQGRKYVREILKKAYEHGNTDLIDRILTKMPQAKSLVPDMIEQACNGKGRLFSFLHLQEKGLVPESLCSAYKSEDLKMAKRWRKVVPGFVPSTSSFFEYPPEYIRPQAFIAARRMMETEGYYSSGHFNGAGEKYAYELAALFRTEDRILQYLKKWGVAGKAPLHDLAQNIDIPKKGRFDLKKWGDAVLKFGPEMARLVKFADKVPVPAETLVKTRALVAQHAFSRAQENPAMAAFCFKHHVKESAFNQALDIIADVSRDGVIQKNIPDITIDGKTFGMHGARFRKLDDDDFRGLFLGEIVDCCQSVGSAGSGCAKHGFTSPDGGFYVIEDKDGEIIGQSWAWRGKRGELVFDSLEFLTGRVSRENWGRLLRVFAKKLERDPGDVTALHVGTGGDTPSHLGFERTDRPAQSTDHYGYSDSGRQFLIWQKEEAVVTAYHARKSAPSL